ncbi:ABC-2 type transport system permease protein [Arthrobacter pigmenti]|uniref:ABC-2 type transport system permease protein n=1 Tax=Arthrobacter pigmenti TaxID=271432 RepID=A0A846RSN7_9MICC|nr:ABC transporter permease subunit [Arthrobacter pigmenti]NJC22685.1 ABC-2 type transport system permease protein [Arthrobacter pigmenti]
MRTEILPLFRRTLRDSVPALLGWGTGLAGVCLLYLPLYPTMGGGAQLQQMIESMPEEMISALGFQNLSTGAGYVQSTVLGLLGFVLLSIAVIGWGTAAVAGEEERGALELTLAHAVTRTQVILEGALALFTRLAILCTLLLVILLILNGPSQLGLQTSAIFAGVTALGGLGLLIGLASLAAGALVRSRTVALLSGTAVAGIGYMFNALGNQSVDLQWLHALSPYRWAYGEAPLSNGFDAGGLTLLYLSSAALILIAVAGLRRRDVGN